MERSMPPDPVKLFAAVLWRDPAVLDAAVLRMRQLWGTVDFEGVDHPFDLTDYYLSEMGSDLKRRLFSFAALLPPESIVDVKLAACSIEEEFRGPSGRRVNLDMGYIDVHKAVLASLKYGGPKVYLGRGVYADMVCRYSKGHYHPYDWSFADFRDGRYEAELLEIRRIYKAGLQE
jgi:hypothetical protein